MITRDASGNVVAINGVPISSVGGTAKTGVKHGGPLGGVQDFLDVLPTYLMIAAGGLIVLISGLALVYVAGRNTAPAKTAKLVANPARFLARRATPKVAPKAVPKAAAAPRVPARPDIAADRERVRAARVTTAEAKAREARSRAAEARHFEREITAAKRQRVLPRPKGLGAPRGPRKGR